MSQTTLVRCLYLHITHLCNALQLNPWECPDDAEPVTLLQNLFQGSFQRLLNKEEGKRATWEYPFAVAGLNISFMLIQMLDLRSCQSSTVLVLPIKRLTITHRTARFVLTDVALFAICMQQDPALCLLEPF